MIKHLFLVVILLSLQCRITTSNAQTTSTSSNLVAQPVPDRTVSFSVSGAGVPKPITWGLDLAWLSEGNIRRGIAFMGADRVDVVRTSFRPTLPLVDGELPAAELDILNQRLNIINTWLGSHTTLVLNCDHPSVHSWYAGNAPRWAQLIDVSARHYQEGGRTIVTVSPFNEPDYTATGQGTITDFYNIAGELGANSRFNGVRISGGNTLNTDQALPWYNPLKARLDEGNTHQLAGNFDNYASFFQTVRASGDHATNDELHNVMEAMVGVEYGMQTGIWWGTAELARGEFVKASDGVRLGYAEHRPNWTAASVYRNTEGKVQGFAGTSERQAVTTTYRFLSKDRDVFYDGHGPQREYTLVMPGGTGYQQGQTNAERVVNITWGDDIQPVISGRYVLVNRNSGKVMEVAGGSTTNGANILQGTYTGATYQQWNVTPVDSRIGGDFSYFTITAEHSGKAVDILNWSLSNGGNIHAWDDAKGGNQQWYLEYVEDGWFYIRGRHSAKCLDVAGGGTADGVNIYQWEKNGGANQQWRFLPVGAPVEFNAPDAPANLVATANAESIRLTWSASSATDVTGYTIFRSESAGGTYTTIARNVPSTSFVDNTATTSTQYFYKIKAVDNSLNRSAYSNEASTTATGNNAIVAQLPFDGNTLDNSVNLNHSATYGGVSYVTGKIGTNAISLNGSNAFVQLPATVANQQEITVATWIYWNGGGPWQRIFDFGNGQTENMFLTPRSGQGTLRFAIKNGGGEQQLNATALPTGQWTHLAVTLGASGASMYVNGELVAESSAFSLSPLDFKPILNYIGRSQYPDPLFNGSIDDFRVYNYALSGNEIRTLTGDLIAHLQFDGNTLDNTINLNHGTSNGGTSYVTGKVGANAISLNGSNAFVQLPATLANQQQITVAAWVYWNGGGVWQRVFDFGNNQAQNMFLTPRSGNGTLRFAIKNGGGEQQLNAAALPTGTWTHVAITLDASAAQMYVNGNLVSESNSVTIRPLDFQPTLNYIGRSQYPDPLFSGHIDDFRVYNYALSASEVALLAGTGSDSATKVAPPGDETRSGGLSVWPMPAKDVIFVNCPSENNGNLPILTVHDLNGRLVISKDIKSGLAEVNVSDLPAGVYVLKLANEKETVVKKLIISDR